MTGLYERRGEEEEEEEEDDGGKHIPDLLLG